MAADVMSAMCGTSRGTVGATQDGFAAFNPKPSVKRRIQQVQEKVCVGNWSQLGDNYLDQVLSDLIDQNSLAAWRTCMDNQGKGIIGTIERDGDAALLRLRWASRFGADRAIIDNVTVTGVECPTMLMRGTVVGNEPLVLRCEGNRDLAIDIVVWTDQGVSHLQSPLVQAAGPKVEPAKSERERCFSGEADACFYATMENGRKCAPLDRSSAAFRACHEESLLLLDLNEGLKARDKACVNRNGTACREATEKVNGILKEASPPASSLGRPDSRLRNH